MKFFFRLLIALMFCLLPLAGGYVMYGLPGPLPRDTPLVVPHGNLALVISELQQQQALPDGKFFRLGFRLAAALTRRDGAIHAGELAFPTHASMRELLQVLRMAPPVEHELTIPEGLTSAQIALLLAHGKALSGPTPMPREGSVLPETYAYQLNTRRNVLLGRMQQTMQRTLDAVWTKRDPALGLADPAQLVTLASIVERETALPAERPLVARVFLNRMRLGMKLQSDPTVAYAASGGLGILGRPLSRADLAQPGPYNTYAVAGLPPGPICAPGEASLQAVAHPATGDQLYFVADGTGGHAFASDLPAHVRNVARLRAREAGPVSGP